MQEKQRCETKKEIFLYIQPTLCNVLQPGSNGRPTEKEQRQRERNNGCFCLTHQPSRRLSGNKRVSRFYPLAGGQWTETGHWNCVQLVNGAPRGDTSIPLSFTFIKVKSQSSNPLMSS